MPEIRLEAYGSGKAPEMTGLAMAFRAYLEEAKEDPEEEKAYQAWLKEYRAKKAQQAS